MTAAVETVVHDSGVVEHVFNIEEIKPDDYRSIDVMVERSEYAREIAETRKPNTIHFSGFWECPEKMLRQARGDRFTDWVFKWANREAARIGDKTHEHAQEQLDRAGLLAQLQSFHEDELIRDLERNSGKLQSAIEVSVNNWFQPYTEYQKQVYLEKYGLMTPPIELLEELNKYKMGGRTDNFAYLPFFSQHIMPIEMKTLFDKYWPRTEKEVSEMTKKQAKDYAKWQAIFEEKLLHYYFQTQFEMHFSFDPRTGQRADTGMVYIINRGYTHKRLQKVIKYDPNFINMWLPIILEIKNAWEGGYLIEGRPSKSDCAFCEFWQVCETPGKMDQIKDWNAIKWNKKIRELAEEASYETMLMVA